MKIFLFAAAFIFLSLILLSCKKDNPVIPPIKPPLVLKDTLLLAVEQVTLRSIVVNIKTTAHIPNSIVELYRQLDNSDTLVAEYPITVKDTTVLDDNKGQELQLNTEYKYYAVRRDSIGEKKDTSNVVTAKTLAPANFNYTWQEYSIGEPGSVLYEIWGSDENNVYACGTIIINDTTVYGIIKWNGTEWSLDKKPGSLLGIYGFSSEDIWAVGGGVWHYNGLVWEEYTYKDPIIDNNRSYTSIWGTSSSDLYFGNGVGRIIHWDGYSAEIVYYGPNGVYVNDMDGYSSDDIIGVGTGLVPPLLAAYYDGASWNNLPISGNQSLNAVSFVTRKHIYFSGEGIFEMKGDIFSQIYNSNYYVWAIEYNKQTGVTVASGASDGVYINNGIEWRDYTGAISNDNTIYNGIFLINNTIFCVGRNDTQAKIIIGRN